jgi:hypothetical protein
MSSIDSDKEKQQFEALPKRLEATPHRLTHMCLLDDKRRKLAEEQAAREEDPAAGQQRRAVVVQQGLQEAGFNVEYQGTQE